MKHLLTSAALAASLAVSGAHAATVTMEMANANLDGNKDGIRATLECSSCEVWYISESDYNSGDYMNGVFQIGDDSPGTVDGTIFNRDVLDDGGNDNGEGTRVDLVNTILGTSYTLADKTETGGGESMWTSSAEYMLVWIGNDQGFRYSLIQNFAANNTFKWIGESAGGGGKSGYDGFGIVPLPAAGWLLLGGLAGLAAMKRRRKAA